MQDKIDGKEIGSRSQEAIAKVLLDLTILDKMPKIQRGEMAGGRYYKIMGLKGGLKAR